MMYPCAVCGTEITKTWDRHGFRVGGSKYKYTKGYLIEEGGRLSTREKADLIMKLPAR